MTYIDAFVAAVPARNRESYLAHAEKASLVFKRHGALKVLESWGDSIPEGEITSFPKAVKCEPGENVVCGFVFWPSKEVRDKGMAEVMEDPDMEMSPDTMPFDGRRLIYGGFEVMLDT
ncbi:MAG: DUF1428 domain-containing protein [Pseudomonadota bacterium]